MSQSNNPRPSVWAGGGSVEDQPEVIQRISAALDDDIKHNGIIPAAHAVPACVMRWHNREGIIRVGSSFRTDLIVNISYLRVADIEMTLAQIAIAKVAETLRTRADLYRLGEIISGKALPKLSS